MNLTKRIVLDSLLVAVIIICAMISFPLGSVPVTLQVFGVFLVIMITPSLDGIIIVGLYVLLGTAGLPVFAGGTSGSFASPAYGFIIGFLLSAVIIGIIKYIFESKEIFKSKKILTFIIYAMLFILITYACGIPYFMVILKMKFWPSLLYFLPFIGIDAAKLIIVYFIYERIKNVIHQTTNSKDAE